MKGYVPLSYERTNGSIDYRETLYFGESFEYSKDPQVKDLIMHGPN